MEGNQNSVASEAASAALRLARAPSSPAQTIHRFELVSDGQVVAGAEHIEAIYSARRLLGGTVTDNRREAA